MLGGEESVPDNDEMNKEEANKEDGQEKREHKDMKEDGIYTVAGKV